VANSTIGGCTAYYQRAETDLLTASLLEQEWDYIVLQSYSILPTVVSARQRYLGPAVQSFVAKKKSAKIIMHGACSFPHPRAHMHALTHASHT